ncbi:MAG: class I SAM-dependent methyltransferase [Bdellovibrionota bacterium]
MTEDRERLYKILFRFYFFVHDFIESRFFYHLCKLLRMPHPKNLHDFRSRDFVNWVDKTDRVADLGCGTGKLVLAVSPKVASAVGVDLSPALLLKDQTNFIRMDILDQNLIPLLTQQGVNTILLSHVLEHLPDPIAFLKRLTTFRKLLICVPSQENWRFQFKQSLGLDARTDPTHCREYTLSMLHSEVEKAGFVVQTSFYNSEGEIFAVCKTL